MCGFLIIHLIMIIDNKSMEIIEVETKHEGTDTEYYTKAADYWENVTPTINGMLGLIDFIVVTLFLYYFCL